MFDFNPIQTKKGKKAADHNPVSFGKIALKKIILRNVL